MAAPPQAQGASTDKQWGEAKSRALGQVDLSRKGSVDEAIVPLVRYINAREEYYTTSSCAGRISIFSENSFQAKKGCQWLLVSHQPLESDQVCTVLSSGTTDVTGYTFFKFEPFVLHVMCRSLLNAQTLLQTAVSAGFRNSGISYGQKGKIMVAVRSTHSLESPVAYDGEMIVSQEYLTHLVKIGNSKMEENLRRVGRFFELLKSKMDSNVHALNPLSPERASHHEKREDTGRDGRTSTESTGSSSDPSTTVKPPHEDTDDLFSDLLCKLFS